MVRVRERKVVEKLGRVGEGSVAVVSDKPSPDGVEVFGLDLDLDAVVRVAEVVESRTCIRSFLRRSSAAMSWSLLPAQLTRRRSRLTSGVILLRFNLLNVRACSSGTSFAGGVEGILLPLDDGDDGCLLWFGKVGEEGESCDTKASAD